MSDDCDWKRDYALAASEMREIRERDEDALRQKMHAGLDVSNAWSVGMALALSWRMFDLLQRINELPYATLPESIRNEVAAACSAITGRSQ